MSGICAVWRKDSPAQCGGDAGRGELAASRSAAEKSRQATDGREPPAWRCQRVSTTQQIYQNSRVLLVCDAELYNEDELGRDTGMQEACPRTKRRQLFWPRCIERFGCDFVEKLRGSFSVIIWDRRERELLAAVDGFGINRLVYYANGKVCWWPRGSTR